MTPARSIPKEDTGMPKSIDPAQPFTLPDQGRIADAIEAIDAVERARERKEI